MGWRRWGGAGLGALALGGACGGAPSPPAAPLAAPAALVDVLGPSAHTGPAARQRVLIGPGVPGPGEAGPVAPGAALVLSAGDAPWETTLAAPARSRCTARVRVDTEGRDGLLLETGAGMVVTEERSGRVVATHAPAAGLRGTAGAVQQLSFETGARTRALRLRLDPGAGGGSGTARFSELWLACGGPWAAVRGGLGPEAPLIGRLAVGDDSRPALLAAGGSRWRVGVAPGPAGAELRTALGRDDRSAGPLCGRVELDGALLAETCVAAGADWAPLTVALPPGPPGWLELVVAAGRGPRVGGWADPRLVPATGPAGAGERPDILVVLVDTLRADAVGPDTPWLSSLMASSTVFRNARSPSPWTLPSAASLLTGLWPGQHGAGWRLRREWSSGRRNTAQKRLLDHAGLQPGVATVAAGLRATGHQTAAFVSNHYLSPAFGLAAGFDRFVHYDGNSPAGLGAVLPALDRFLAAAPRSDGPRFVLVQAFEPHLPYRVRPPEPPPAALVGAMEQEEGGAWLVRDHLPATTADPAALRAAYQSEVRWLDAQLPALVSRLPGAVVAITADHGEAFGEHGSFGHGQDLSEELLRVPLVLHLPGAAPAVVDTPVGLVDLAQTLRALGGAPPVGPGRDLRGPLVPADQQLGFVHRGPDRVGLVRGAAKLVRSLPAGGLDPVVGAALDRWEGTGPDGAPLPAGAARGPLAAALDGVLGASLPGHHLRCGPGTAATLTSPTALLRQVVLVQGPATDVGLPPGQRSLALRVGPEDPPLWVVVEAAGGATPTLSPPGACTLHAVGVGAAGALTPDQQAALAAIGYLAP